VKDPSGAVVASIHITVTKLMNEKTGAAQEAVPTSTGTYVFQSVQAGTYSLKEQFKGFGTFAEQGIEVNVQHINTVDVPLTMGSSQSDIVVTATAPLLQSESAAVAQTTLQSSGRPIPHGGPMGSGDPALNLRLQLGVITFESPKTEENLPSTCRSRVRSRREVERNN
jgi:hypothetical protein